MRLVYEGAEYRGRARTTTWDGSLTVEGNRILRTAVINNWNLDRGIQKQDATSLAFKAVTTGNYGAIDLWLESAAGKLAFKTAPVSGEAAIAELGVEPRVFAAGGLERAVKLQRLPEIMREPRMRCAAGSSCAPPATPASTSACSRRTATACGRARSTCFADPHLHPSSRNSRSRRSGTQPQTQQRVPLDPASLRKSVGFRASTGARASATSSASGMTGGPARSRACRAPTAGRPARP